MGTYCAHTRQFLIGNEAKEIKENWKSVKIAEDLYLSHCLSLSVQKAEDLSGKEWHLLGIAIQTDKEKPDPLTQIGTSLTDGVKEIYKSWTGRWILVGNNEIHIDCSGSLGCFYTKINGERWISSSLAILQEIGSLSPRPDTLKYESGIEWYPLPMSRFKGVDKLLPSQFLNLKTFNPEQRALPKPISGLSYNEILEKITEKLKFSLLNVSNSGKRIFLPLTAGHDSRLLLAAVQYAGIKVETVTTAYPKIAYSDFSLPFKLSKAAGYNHKYIRKSKFSKDNEELYDYHNARNTDHIHKIWFSHGQYDFFKKNDVILRGGIFEVARCFYWKKMDSNLSIESIFKAWRRVKYDHESFHVRALTEWVKWVKQTPTEGLDWRDRFYLEQRVGGWLSSGEQALDLTDTERLHIINCHDLISLLLSIPVEKRRTSEHHVDLINKMYPSLLLYPFNRPDPRFKKLQKKISRISKMPLYDIYKKLKKVSIQ
ncbi:MAG: hypothetical protein H0V14_03365 [Chitinophagaceae bacterium]|nr:hypothetical protein [Chitinophagaceae bacterium]